MKQSEISLEVLSRLIGALMRKGTEQDGGWGWPSFHDEMLELKNLIDGNATPPAPMRSPRRLFYGFLYGLAVVLIVIVVAAGSQLAAIALLRGWLG